MWVVELPVGAENSKRGFLQEVSDGEPAELIKALVPKKNPKARF